MKILRFFFISLVALSIFSCKKDEEGSLTIHFKAIYDGLPLAMFGTKPFTSPQQLQFSHLSLFISNLALVDQSSTEELRDIELVDLSFDDVNSADMGYTVHFDQIPAKTYTGIQFGVGVPPDLNAKSPSEFPSSSPLSKTSYYWEAWHSYIFMKTEGHLDSLGTGAFDTGFAFHTGTDELYLLEQGPFPINIEDGKDKVIEILLDYKDVLAGIDIKSNPQNHNPQDSVQIKQLVENLGHSFSLVQ